MQEAAAAAEKQKKAFDELRGGGKGLDFVFEEGAAVFGGRFKGRSQEQVTFFVFFEQLFLQKKTQLCRVSRGEDRKVGKPALGSLFAELEETASCCC